MGSRRWAACGVLLLAAACARPVAPTPGLVRVLMATATPRPAALGPDAAALAAVDAEAEAVRQQDIDALAALWLPSGSAVDAAHSPDDASDDRAWLGWEAVRNRYVTEVFPYVAEPVLLPRARAVVPVVRVSNDEAEVLVPGVDGKTTQDRWRLRRVDGQWRILSLTYNLTPAS
jgi:hypothetical protein